VNIAGGMTQIVDSPLSKHKALSSNPSLTNNSTSWNLYLGNNPYELAVYSNFYYGINYNRKN
jgi:hypothetical protein